MRLTVRVLGHDLLVVDLGPRLPEPPPPPQVADAPTSVHRHAGDFSFGFTTTPDRGWLPSDIEASHHP